MTDQIFPKKSGGRRRFGYGWDRYYEGRGKIPICLIFLSGGGSIDSIVWIGIVGHVRGNGEESGGNPYKLPKVYHGE